MGRAIRLLPVDFTKPWWKVIADQKMLASTMMLVIVLRDLIPVLIPFLVTYTLEKESWYFFAGIVVLWVCGEIGGILQRRLVAQFQLQCIHSILHSAHQYLLAIDPQYHVKRSSGVILAKIERAARGYEEVLDQIALEFVPLAIGIAGMIIVLSHYSLLLGGVVFVCLGTMLMYGYYFASYRCQKWENDFIATDDDFKAVAFENLAQVHLIRATFATDYIRDKLTAKAERNSVVEKALWLSYARVSGILSMLHTASILMVLGFFVYCVQHGIVSLAFATGLVLAYIQSTRQLTKILKPFRHYMRGYAAIKDLFEFLPQFGHQTITVFGNDELVAKKDGNITVIAKDLLFGYGKEHIFDNHTLHIESGTQQRNKLYGIIGPSGVGKTTLFSILGGQLKPLQGTIMINETDIYAVGDSIRRQLIAIQGQISSNIKGTVRYNLLFGLPQNHGYTDEYLSQLLQQLGLELLLTGHGLETILGEGALNISGGQRQRLNFAGLYLRARYYKPLLILIDEPTSSLDEISERAVTSMISELASQAVTLVIAHRLKTLSNAIGLIDLSLLSAEKEVRIYNSQDLAKVSAYYQKLLEGKVEMQ